MHFKYIILKNILLVLILFYLLSCSRTDKEKTYRIDLKNGIENVFNNKPLYREGKFINFEKLNSIELLSDKYEISYVSDMAVDNEKNLYVLSVTECEITVFDSLGNYNRTMGRPGEGPQDLNRPIRLSLYENKLHIIEGYNSIKIWDTNGEYLQKIIIPASNYSMVKCIKDNFLLLSYMRTKNINIMNWSLYKISMDFNNKDEIFNYEINSDTNDSFSPQFVLAINENNQFYFPEKNDKYSIIKYDFTGKPIISFGRYYKRIPFSEAAKKTHQKRYAEAVKRGWKYKMLPKYPPIIRKLFLDSKENIWIISGESNQDVDDKLIEVEVDIFNKDGILLYSFKTNNIVNQSFIKNDRMYSLTKISQTTGQQYINVYKIHYNYEN